jgi:hypothetical protein
VRQLSDQQQPNELQIIEPEMAKVCDAVQEAIAAEHQAMAAIHHLIRTKIIAGELLAAKRESAKRGDWVAWCDNVLPISYDTANRWIGLFLFIKTRGEHALDDAKTVRQAYVLAGLLPESQGGTSGGGSSASEDAYLTDLVRTNTRLSAQVAKRPLAQWPVDQLRSLRERLKPLVELYVEVQAIA